MHIDNSVRANLDKLFHKFFQVNKMGIQMTVGFTDSYEAVIQCQGYFYKVGDKYFPLKKISAPVTLTYDRVHFKNPENYCVIDLHTGEEIASYSAILTKYQGKDMLANFVKVPGEKFMKFAAVNPSKPRLDDFKFTKPVLLKEVKMKFKKSKLPD